MLTNLNPAAGRIPAFKNILSLRSSPRVPIIPYFTRPQWEMAIKGLRRVPQSKSDSTILRLHYQPAPWGRGDIIVFFEEFVLGNQGSSCTPKIKVKREKNGVYRIEMGVDCPPPQTRAGCEAFLRVFVDHVPEGVSPWACKNDGCDGQCNLVLEGAQTVGDIYCLCNRVV